MLNAKITPCLPAAGEIIVLKRLASAYAKDLKATNFRLEPSPRFTYRISKILKRSLTNQNSWNSFTELWVSKPFQTIFRDMVEKAIK